MRSDKESEKGVLEASEKSKETLAGKDKSGISKVKKSEKCPIHTPFPHAL